MYNIYYIGDNESLKEELPFAKQIDSTEDINSTTSLYWVIDSDVVVTDYSVFDYVPDRHTAMYGHAWKWNEEDYGGVRLLPKKGNKETVMHNKIVCKKQFQILFEQSPGNYFENNPQATHVWCVDSEYKLADNIDWAPGNFEPGYIHSFHLRGQLEHRYPEKEGGVKLYPREWNDSKIKYHDYLDATIHYPVLYVDDVEDYSQRDSESDEYVWLIDKQHLIQDDINWAPNPFEYKMIHSFKMPNQLQDKYPMSMGGVRLVPDNWRDAEVKIHRTCPIRDIQYDVFYVNEKEFTVEKYNELFSECNTDWMWVIDEDLKYINGEWLYVPTEFEQEYIHVFKMPGHLDYRYPADIKEPHDIRCGGVRLVRNPMRAKPFRNFVEEYIYKEDVIPVKYDLFYSDDIMDYEKFKKQSKTDMFWLVDSEHQITKELNYVPQEHDNEYILIFKYRGDLEFKYPRAIESVSDYRAGGVKLVPVNEKGKSKFITTDPTNDIESEELAQLRTKGYEVFDSYDEGLQESSYNWFWVVDKDVDILSTFDFRFQPNAYDVGKQHVWQKQNPLTGKQYDYGGISLRHKNEVKGRPKYIREISCTQQEYPVYYLQPEELKDGLDDVYERLAQQTSTSMMYIVDPYVDIDAEFKFDYYPTQYDVDVVHAWEHSGSKGTAVRLIPTNIEFKSEKQILNNEFDRLKEMPVVASKDKQWQKFTFEKNKPLLAQLKDFREQSSTELFYTIDYDVNTPEGMVNFTPEPVNHNKVHTWQRANPVTGKAHSYGGIRLWPKQLPDITSDDIKVNKMPRGQLQYVKEIASIYKYYAIVLITYKQDNAEELLSKLPSHTQLVQDVEGIFNAHKKASEICESDMFWVVDGDAVVKEDFDFSYIPDVYDQEVTHVWNSENPVTGDTYGYGGVKLFNTKQVQQATSWGIDFTTGLSTRFKVMPEVACTTQFNTDEYSTWRSAFRECVKLTLNTDEESAQRLNKWLNADRGDFVEQAIQGAKAGNEYAKQHINDVEALNKINDYEWLREYYES